MDPVTISILLSMQAAGMVFDWAGMQKQKDLAKKGMQLEQAGINANISMTRLQAEDASLQAMQNLRQTLGSQAAYMAASGGRANPFAGNQAISKAGEDERIRRLNLSGKEAELTAEKALSKLHYQGYASGLDQQFISKIFNMLPGPSAFSGMGKSGGTGGVANSARSNYSQPSVARNFGMKPYQG